jgi:hypothetical protein
MPHFLVEVYAPRSARLGELEAAAHSAARAAAGVLYLESIHVPEDETCFHLFDGPSAGAVEEAARRGALIVQRVARADRPGSRPRRTTR